MFIRLIVACCLFFVPLTACTHPHNEAAIYKGGNKKVSSVLRSDGLYNTYDTSLMPCGTYKYALSPGDPGYSAIMENLDYARYWGFNDYTGSYYAPSAAGWKATIYNVNSKSMGSMYGNIKGGLSLGGGSALKYGYPWGGCYGQVARALFRAGVPTVPFYGFTPHGLVMQLWLRQAGIYASPYLINK